MSAFFIAAAVSTAVVLIYQKYFSKTHNTRVYIIHVGSGFCDQVFKSRRDAKNFLNSHPDVRRTMGRPEIVEYHAK